MVFSPNLEVWCVVLRGAAGRRSRYQTLLSDIDI